MKIYENPVESQQLVILVFYENWTVPYKFDS